MGCWFLRHAFKLLKLPRTVPDVETRDVVAYIRTGLLPGAVGLAADLLDLHGTEEALHRRVVPHLPGATYRAGNAVLPEPALEVLTGVLATLVRVVQQFLRPAAAPNGFIKASATRCEVMLSGIDQPTMRRAYSSGTAAT